MHRPEVSTPPPTKSLQHPLRQHLYLCSDKCDLTETINMLRLDFATNCSVPDLGMFLLFSKVSEWRTADKGLQTYNSSCKS